MLRRFTISFYFVSLIWLAVFFLPIGNRGLWDPDEPRYTQVAWEMDRAGSLLLPIRNGELYAQKPPLFFWATIAVAKVTGFETASRRVSAVAALLTLWIVYALMRRFRSRESAFTACMVLMSCGLYMWLAGHGNIDVMLTMFTTASAAAWLMHLDTRGTRWLWLLYGCCGLGILTKGPVALVLPLLSIIVFLVFMRTVKKERLPWIHLLWGWLPVLVVTAAWLLPACIAGGENYTRQILFRQNIGRAVHSFAHAKPFTYYFGQFPVLTLPWFAIFAGLLPWGRRQSTVQHGPAAMRSGDSHHPVPSPAGISHRTAVSTDSAKDDQMSPGARYLTPFLIIALITIFVFFTLISGKRGRYLLPMFPLFAMLIAEQVQRSLDRSRRFSIWNAAWEWLAVGVAGVLGIAVTAAPFLKPLATHFDLTLFPLSHWRVVTGIILSVSGGFCLFLFVRWRRRGSLHHAYSIFAAAVLLFFLAGQLHVVPLIDPEKSAESLAQCVTKLLKPGQRLFQFNTRYDGGLNFYAKIPVIPEINPDGPGEITGDILILVRQKDYDKLENWLGYPPRIIHSESVGRKEWYLVRPNTEKDSVSYDDETTRSTL